MAETIRFTKMQGAGNDYIYVNTLRYPVQHPEEAARQWSAPHTGIGSDGLVLIGTSTQADFSMRIFNADGSEAMMCGNASRCIGKYVYDYGLTEKTTVTLDTLSGIKTLQLHTKDNRVETVTVDMGIPTPGPGNLREQTIGAGEYAFIGTTVSMGNPHLVIFTDNLTQIPLSEVGPQLEHHPWFPDRINVEFAQIWPDGSIRMRVWERGSGITQACGTGACATAVAACLTGRTGRHAVIRMDGGDLTIDWDKDTRHVLMTGGATKVFDGEIEITQ